MKEIYFSCTLLTDVVLNSKLATEGNMTTMDYIPGSNFLGIVAAQLYKQIDSNKAYKIFHSGDVSFGDALITRDVTESFKVPFNLFMVKGEESLGTDHLYVHQEINEKNHPEKNGYRVQLKQVRNGYFSTTGKVLDKIKKTFALKSAQDANFRKSKESAMFGFESLKKDQVFIFSVKFSDERFVDDVTKALIGNKRLGKSRTAEFGQVEIRQINTPIPHLEHKELDSDTLVYAQSNLCFVDEYVQPKLQPNVADLGLLSGTINWEKSQVRTYSYAPWNGQRKTIDPERHCIAMGSVFYVQNIEKPTVVKKNTVGEFQSEGLGRVLYNPVFLFATANTIQTDFYNRENVKDANNANHANHNNINTPLGKFLVKKLEENRKQLKLSNDIHSAVKDESSFKILERITPSQWGNIRTLATQTKNIKELILKLFGENLPGQKPIIGVLGYGIAYDRYWGVNKEKPLNELKNIINKNESLGCEFVAKYAAEMAKEKQKKDKKN
jgi:hypothetical protein